MPIDLAYSAVYDSCTMRPTSDGDPTGLPATGEEARNWLRRYGPLGPDAPQPLVVTGAEGAWVEDADGRRYLDFSCGASAPLGYDHPEVARIIAHVPHLPACDGVEWLAPIALMRKLAEMVPGGMNRRVLLVDSGREALAKAIALAQAATGKCRVQYLSELKGDSPRLNTDTAALVCHPLDPRLEPVRRACTDRRILLIDDETGIGPGATGKAFAVEWSGVRPDLYVLGRGWAAGLPFGACVAGSSNLRWNKAGAGGSVTSCAAALELVRLLAGGLLDRAVALEAAMKERLESLCRSSLEGTITGRGLVWTLVFPPESVPAQGFAERCREAGLLLRRLADDALGIRPPLTVEKQEIDAAVGIMGRVMAEFERGRS